MEKEILKRSAFSLQRNEIKYDFIWPKSSHLPKIKNPKYYRIFN